MSSGLRAGSVFATFGVQTDEWTKGLRRMVADTAKTLKQIEGIGSKLGGLGMAWGASLGAAVAVASERSPELKSALDEIKDSFLDIAAEVGIQFLPAMQSIAAAVRDAATFFQSLNPELKAALASFAGTAASALLAAGAIGKFSGFAAAGLEGLNVAIGGVASAFKLVGVVIAGISAPVLAVIAVVAVLVLAAGAVYKAWNDSTSGFREAVRSMLDTLTGWGASVADFFVGLWDGITDFLGRASRKILDLFAGQIRSLARLLAPLAEFIGWEGGSAFLRELEGVTGETLLAGLEKGAKFVWSGVKVGANYLADKVGVAATAIKDGILYGADGLRMAAADAAAKLKDATAGMFGGSAQAPKASGKPIAVMIANPEAISSLRMTNTSTLSASAGDIAKQVGTRPDPASTRINSTSVSTTGPLAFHEMNKGAKTYSQQFADGLKNTGKNIANAMKGAAMSFVNKLGDVGQVANAAVEGAQMGGVWGAIIAVILELFSMFEGFQELIDIANGSLMSHVQVLADAFGTLVEALGPLLGAVSYVIDVVLGLLAPIIEALAGILESLTPLIYLIGFLFEGLQPVFEMLAKVVEGLVWILDKIIWGLFQVLKGVGLAILGVIWGLAKAWNGIISAIQSVFRLLGELDIGGWKPLEFLNGWADGLESAKANTAGLEGAMDSLTGMTWEAANAASRENAERLKATAQLEKMNEALTNIPAGLKVATLRFNASDAVGGGGGGGGGALIATMGGRYEPPVEHTTINIEVTNGDPRAVIAAVEEHERQKAFRRTGSRHAR